mmetsp:Transcript_38915/g.94088  ORF Transcript_38915/g.94088 Transcript_38915/m.94088 type:complete len:141 (+) Transcript_38915:436-858(+)
MAANDTLLTPTAYFVSAVSGIFGHFHRDLYWAISQIFGTTKHHELVVNVLVSWWYAFDHYVIAHCMVLSLFLSAICLFAGCHGLKAFPNRDEAAYLYHVAHRICIDGELPKSLTFLSTSESIDFTPDDSQYEDFYTFTGK